MLEREPITALVEKQESAADPLWRYVDLFVVNPQIYARQSADGGSYYKVEALVSHKLIRRHFRGEITLGFYATSPDGAWVKWVCLDHDQAGGLAELAGLARRLQSQDIPSLLEGSRRGGHLWIFFDQAPTIAAREYARHLAEEEDLSVDIYPRSEEGLSLMRGPLGVHKKSNRRYPFYDPDTLKPVSLNLRGNLEYLTQVERVQVAKLAEELALRLRAVKQAPAVRTNKESATRRGGGDRSEIVALKERIGDLRTFIGQFVELNPKGRGSCPFHPPDKHPSFAVHETFWVCFHEIKPNGKYLGGDVIEFWMRYRGVDFPTALEELKRLVE